MSHAPLRHCRQCHRPVLVQVPRCPQCGARRPATAAPSPSAPAPDTGGDVRPDGFKRYMLDPLQRQILAAAATEGRSLPIYVMPGKRGGDGEVKAGAQRLFGDEALAAVIGLISLGLAVEVDEACFGLTTEGERAGALLQNPIRRMSAEVWLPGAAD